MYNDWIGVDLDGMLALYGEWEDETHIGEPIPLMLERVKRWVAEGKEVKIFSARVSLKNPRRTEACKAIKEWCRKHIGVELDVTAEKDYWMMALYDDRCFQVEFNTGVLIVHEEEREENG